MNPLPQAVLIARFELWFQEEMPRLYRYLCYQTHEQSAAEEITSIVCEKALKKLAQYDSERGDLRLWMFGIARNELRAYYRSLKRQPSPVSLDCLPDFSFSTQSPEEQYQHKEAFVQVLKTLAVYPEREQEIIALRFGAGLPLQQIATILELDENHVAVLLHRTLEKLKKSLKENLEEVLNVNS